MITEGIKTWADFQSQRALPHSRKRWQIQLFRLFERGKFDEWPNNGKWILKIL